MKNSLFIGDILKNNNNSFLSHVNYLYSKKAIKILSYSKHFNKLTVDWTIFPVETYSKI